MGLGLGACKHGPSPAELRGAEYLIRKVEFEGNERFKPGELHEYLELRPTERLPPQRYWFYEGLIPIDSERLVALYHAHGYFEADVVDVRVDHIERKRKRERKKRVDLTFVIEEGPLTRVGAVQLRWPEGPAVGPSREQRSTAFARAPSVDPADIAKLISIEVDDPFEVPAINRSAAAVRERLRQAGYPYASVEHLARVSPEAQTASVDFEVRPGPFMRIGELEITGLATVPERPVRVELERLIGRPYSPALVQQIEQRTYALGVFSTVTIDQQPSDRSNVTLNADQTGTLDLEIAVKESDPQRIRVGVGLGFEPNRWDQRVSARYSHENLFRALYRLRLTARAGYAELPNLIQPQAHGPFAEIDLHAEKKGLLEKHLVWTLEPKLELGIEQGYQYWSSSHRFGLSRFFTRWVQLRLNHTLRYVNFFSISPTLRTQDTFLSLDFRDPYIISAVGLGATVFAVDQIAAPNQGAVIGIDYQVAGGPFGGQYDFQEITPFVRLYWRPIERLQIAARARVGLIFPFGDQPGAPIDLRSYLGGTDTVRGWGLRRLSPRVDDCEPGENYRDGTCTSIPVGGNTAVLANVEVRVRTWKQLWVAGFVDGGDVQAGVASFVPKEWNYSAGGGLRYDTPIGKFRLDVGFRLNDTPLSEGEPIWALHFGLGESF
ncbi:Outer membrane protein assembly factor YaeT precursor [Enhygromyxa salina]|uniref:Outer membrane protein assembly factor YaeT n=1 Tax=Enhygromyxa salina TaxID=215803 RepID=A0A0C2D3A3_9BACT|nr:Outer membrane protein assembly factor YaeT precursor [Enhygromyxa salina]